MKDNERLIEALRNVVEICSEVEIIKFLRYLSSVDDMNYLSDGEIAELIECYNKFAKDGYTLDYCEFEPNEMFYFEPIYLHTAKRNYSFTKENEMIAYERYQESVKGRVFFDLFEKINMRDMSKSINEALSGRGGGKPQMIQGSFTSTLKDI